MNSRKQFVILTVGVLLSWQSHAQQLKSSPIGVQPHLERGLALRAGDQHKEYAPFKRLTEWLYDRLLKRPWEEKEYIETAELYLQEYRAVVCPALKEFCDLTSHIKNEKDVDALISVMSQANVQQALQKRFATLGYFIDFARYTDGAKIDFQVSKRDKSSTVNPALWDLKGANVMMKEKEIVLLQDLATYRIGMEHESTPPSYYVGLNDSNEIILNIDRAKIAAANFGQMWHSAMSDALKNPKVFDNAAHFDHEKFALLQLYKKYYPLFVLRYEQLRTQLKALPSPNEDVAKILKITKKNFTSQRGLPQYPFEVFEHVAYEILINMYRTQGEYLYLSKLYRPKLQAGSSRQSWEALLSLQAYSQDAAIVPFLINSEVGFPKHYPLDQFATPNVARDFLYEEIKAILSLQEYKDLNIFKRFRYLFQKGELFTKEALQNENPEVVKDLGDKKISDLSDEELKKLLQKLIITPEGKRSITGEFKVRQNLLGYITDEDSRELARQVHQVQKEHNFINPPPPKAQ